MIWDWEGVKVWEIIVLAFKMTKAPGEIIWGGGGKKNKKDDSQQDRHMICSGRN